jgi:TolA-binding protein
MSRARNSRPPALAGLTGMAWMAAAAVFAWTPPVEATQKADRPAAAAPAPPTAPAPAPPQRTPPSAGDQGAPADSEMYRAILRSTLTRSPGDTLGNGLYEAARNAFNAGAFDVAQAGLAEFARVYTRNLNLNDALEMRLLIQGYRDFEGKPLLGYARTLAFRAAGRPDSATAVATHTLAQWPGAKVRWHLRYQLAELARERGDHPAAIVHALAVADTSAKSRLAPSALKLAGDESLALGQGPDQALKIYQELLRRYPSSPLAPGVRAQVLEMRKKLQL